MTNPMIVPSKNQDIKRSNRNIFAREMVMMMSLLHACSSPPPPSIDRLGLSSKTSSYAHLYVIMLDTFITCIPMYIVAADQMCQRT